MSIYIKTSAKTRKDKKYSRKSMTEDNFAIKLSTMQRRSEIRQCSLGLDYQVLLLENLAVSSSGSEFPLSCREPNYTTRVRGLFVSYILNFIHTRGFDSRQIQIIGIIRCWHFYCFMEGNCIIIIFVNLNSQAFLSVKIAPKQKLLW